MMPTGASPSDGLLLGSTGHAGVLVLAIDDLILQSLQLGLLITGIMTLSNVLIFVKCIINLLRTRGQNGSRIH